MRKYELNNKWKLQEILKAPEGLTPLPQSGSQPPESPPSWFCCSETPARCLSQGALWTGPRASPSFLYNASLDMGFQGVGSA